MYNEISILHFFQEQLKENKSESKSLILRVTRIWSPIKWLPIFYPLVLNLSFYK